MPYGLTVRDFLRSLVSEMQRTSQIRVSDEEEAEPRGLLSLAAGGLILRGPQVARHTVRTQDAVRGALFDCILHFQHISVGAILRI